MMYVGMGRELRRRIAAQQAIIDAAQGALLAPLRPRPGFTPMPRHALLREIAEKWRRLSGMSRLACLAAFEDGSLSISELRCRAVKMRMPGWTDGDDEPCIAVALTLVRCAPPAFSSQRIILLDVGLHALARRYQRGDGRDDAAVLGDLRLLAQAHPTIVKSNDNNFTVAIGGGRCLGVVTRLRSDHVMCARIFV